MHPLDPLTADELAHAVAILRRHGALGDDHRLITLVLDEPPKDEAHWRADLVGAERHAFAVVRERGTNAVTEHRVGLADGAIASTPRPGVQAAFSLSEYEVGIPVVKADPRVQAGLAARGITDLNLVHVELWPMGGQIPAELAGRRIVWAALWLRHDPTDNQYAHPIRGLEVIYDMGAEEVARVIDHGVVAIPRQEARWLPEELGELRAPAAALAVTQPDGPGFRLDGRCLTWEGWALRIGFEQREGLTLHAVAYEGRPVCYRASIAELAIPYADTDSTSYRKSAFDIGEIGLGHFTNALELGCDCLGDITYLDVDLATDTGEVVRLPNAICIHEEDAGILWKHVDHGPNRTEVRRSRRLVISSIVTVDNYEYGFYWYLHQDGAIEFEAKLTGIILTAASPPGEVPRAGTLVAPGVNGMWHQHFFCARLDLDIDGAANAVYEVHSEFAGDTFTVAERLLETEAEDAGLIDPLAGRHWRIVNRGRANAVGGPSGYRLMPGGNVRMFMSPDTPMGRRMAFCRRHLWVTPHDRAERWPAGDYVNLSDAAQGLPEWTQAAEPVVDRDVVVWYAFGSHHVPRPEDWPVMPVVRIGFRLEPYGFFDRNPSITQPPETPACRARSHARA
jgi:primary-amine oxidase